MARSLPLAFFEMLGGGILVLTGLSESGSISDTLSGNFQLGLGAIGNNLSSNSTGGGGTVGPVSFTSKGETNPVPGATGSRLDQGFDVTSKTFLSPFTGKVVYSTPSDSGWNNGGVVSIADANDPSRVIYFAEGLRPTVQVGQTVKAGQQIAVPVASTYNGIVGNIEFGPANPAAPGQPLAQVVSDPAGEVMKFYNWITSLGGPKATSTGNAGFP